MRTINSIIFKHCTETEIMFRYKDATSNAFNSSDSNKFLAYWCSTCTRLTFTHTVLFLENDHVTE